MKSRPTAIASACVLVLLVLLALVCIANSMAGHLTPDVSIYLLHARTFVETLDRFTLSHDSKGILLTLALSPAVLVFGATMAAAAFTQLVAYAIAFFCINSVVRSYAHGAAAAIIGLLCICTVYSHLIWGGNMRPEDLALGYAAIALLGAFRGTPKWLCVGGVMIACSLFTKTTLMLGPVAVLIAGCFAPHHRGQPTNTGARENMERAVRNLCWVGVGFGLTVIVTIGWIAVLDSFPSFYRQCIEWPAEYRPLKFPGAKEFQATTRLFRIASLSALLPAAFLGLVSGWLHGMRRLSVLTACLLIAELFRTAIEGSLWPYSLTVMVMPALIGVSLFGHAVDRSKPASLMVWLVPLCFMMPLLAGTTGAEVQAFDYRVIRRAPSPYEHFAALMKAAGYVEGESVFVADNDYQLVLLLRAARPYRILPLHYPVVSDDERAAARDYYSRHPPKWVVTKHRPPAKSVMRTDGHVDYAYHVIFPPSDMTFRVEGGAEGSGADLCPGLPETAHYREIINTGRFRAWRRCETRGPRGRSSE